jgi:hypothetical protein
MEAGRGDGEELAGKGVARVKEEGEVEEDGSR